MRLLAAASAGLFAYLLVGFVVGVGPTLRWTPRSGDTAKPGRTWLAQAGLDVTPARFWLASAGAGGAALIGGLLATGTVWVAIPPAVAITLLPRWFYARRRIRRLAEVQEAWPDGLRHLVASIRSGLTLPAALEEMSRTGPEPLRQAFSRLPLLVRLYGVEPALRLIREEVADPTTDRVIEVLLVAHERGGPLVPDILGDLADATTRDVHTAAEIHTNSLEQRLNARIVFVMPWLVLLLLTSRPGAFRDFYSSPAGFIVIVIAAVLSITGSLLVVRLGREDVELRVFGGAAETAEAG